MEPLAICAGGDPLSQSRGEAYVEPVLKHFADQILVMELYLAGARVARSHSNASTKFLRKGEVTTAANGSCTLLACAFTVLGYNALFSNHVRKKMELPTLSDTNKFPSRQ